MDSATSSDSSLDIPASPIQLPHIPPVSIAAIVAPVAADMQQMNANLRSIAGDRDPALQAAADQIFAAGGKKLRPMIVFLIARATAALAGLRCGGVPSHAGLAWPVMSQGSRFSQSRLNHPTLSLNLHSVLVPCCAQLSSPLAVYTCAARRAAVFRLPTQPASLSTYTRQCVLRALLTTPCSDLTAEQRRLAEITEMIHTASLVHDDVLDECSVRRGAAFASSRRAEIQADAVCVVKSSLLGYR